MSYLPENFSWPQNNAFSGSPVWLFGVTQSICMKGVSYESPGVTLKSLHRKCNEAESEAEITVGNCFLKNVQRKHSKTKSNPVKL